VDFIVPPDDHWALESPDCGPHFWVSSDGHQQHLVCTTAFLHTPAQPGS
jgi:hypothetical protein